MTAEIAGLWIAILVGIIPLCMAFAAPGVYKKRIFISVGVFLSAAIVLAVMATIGRSPDSAAADGARTTSVSESTPTTSPPDRAFTSTEQALQTLSGKWEGEASQPGGNTKAYLVTLIFARGAGGRGSVGQSIYTSPIECGGHLVAESVHDNELILQEIIDPPNASHCRDGTMTIRATSTNTIHWEWAPEAGSDDASADLQRST